ncbi:MAG: flagellar hook-associated protein FlgK, partial [Alphaproteobacteria bacterium]
GALSVALSGLQASTAASQIISSNVSNAQTPGYTSKNIELTSSVLGDAVVSGYSRVSDSVLSATLNAATSNASYLSTQNGFMNQVQEILDSSGDPPALAGAISNFQSAWTQYAASSDSSIQQQSVISAGQQLVSTVNNIASQASALQTQVQGDLSTTVSSLNTDLTKVQTLNNQIATARADNQPTGNLEDQRDQAVNAISAIANVQVMQRSGDQIAIYTPGGSALLDGGSAQVFSVSVSGDSVINALGADVSGILTGGTLQAQTDFLSTSSSTANGVGVVNKIISQLQNFANLFVGGTTNSGSFAATYNPSGNAASSFFSATLDGNGLPELATFVVNPSLVSGATTLNTATATATANTFTATNLAVAAPAGTTSGTFTATGLTTTNQTYAQIASSILSGFQQAANAIQTASTSATAQQTYYQSALSSETGVNTDTELVNLTNWQNSYAASAHVISTIESMFTVLEGMV